MTKRSVSTSMIYTDEHIKLYKDRILFYPWFFPETRKTIMYSNIKNFGERKSSLIRAKPKISGSRDFVNWFTWDTERQNKKQLIFLETDHKIFKRIWFAPKKHSQVIEYLKKYITKPAKNKSKL